MIESIFGCDTEMSDLKEPLDGEKEPLSEK